MPFLRAEPRPAAARQARTTSLTATPQSEHSQHGKREIKQRDGISNEVLLICCGVAVRAAEGQRVTSHHAEQRIVNAGKERGRMT
jgi:hypothetical protein